MLTRILCVDDEPNILQAIERQFRKEFQISTAVGPQAGLQALTEQGPFAVVVSDLRMPGMDGIEFLSRVRAISPDTVRVMLTGQADLEAAAAAVNRGNIFQFLTKPCPAETLSRVLAAAQEQHRLITAERELLEQTLRSSVGVLTEILSLVNPQAFGRAQRIRRYVVHMAERLKLPERWQFELAAMLSQIGSVAVPPEILEKQSRMEPLTPQESQVLAAQSKIGFDLLSHIPRLETVARMVVKQETPWIPAEKPETAAIGGQLLKVARDFDEQVIRGMKPVAVLAAMGTSREYNPDFVGALQEVHVEDAQAVLRRVSLAQLKTGMIIHEDVRSRGGLLLLAKGQAVSDSALACLKSFALTKGIAEPICVLAANAGAPVIESGKQEAYSIGAALPVR